MGYYQVSWFAKNRSFWWIFFFHVLAFSKKWLFFNGLWKKWAEHKIQILQPTWESGRWRNIFGWISLILNVCSFSELFFFAHLWITGYLDGTYASLAMVNYPYSTSFIAPLPPNPVSEFCARLNGSYNDYQLLDVSFFIIFVRKFYSKSIISNRHFKMHSKFIQITPDNQNAWTLDLHTHLIGMIICGISKWVWCFFN